MCNVSVLNNNRQRFCLKASEKGKEIIKNARTAKGRTIDNPEWLIEASFIIDPNFKLPDQPGIYANGISPGPWKRFLQGKCIRPEAFKAFCEVLELNWQDVVDRLEKMPTNPNFFGREKAIADIDELINNQNANMILIYAAGGTGKTELAQQYLTSRFKVFIKLSMAKETQNVSPVEGIVEEWIKHYFKKESTGNFAENLQLLKRLLENQNRSVGILIDNLEPALKDGIFTEHHRGYVDLLQVLSDNVNSVTIITSREKLAESCLNINHYLLPILEEEAWIDYCHYQSLNIDYCVLKEMHNSYGGNAKAMTIIAGAIKQDYDGYMANYWEENKSYLLARPILEDLVNSQFQRLKNHNFDAYRLLYRLSCYRYQDIPDVSIDGLKCLLWDVESNRQLGVINQLKNRCLVEHKNGRYWLHPVIKEKAIQIIQSTEDWAIVNLKCADFWTQSINNVENIKDALTAFEAYYHYVTIEDYEKVAKIIIQTRDNKWQIKETLGRSFYRLGLLQKMIESINVIIPKLQQSYCLFSLYPILSVSHWLLGNIQKSLEIHQESDYKMANFCLDNSLNTESKEELKYLQSVSYFHRSLCYLDLRELDKTIEFLQECIKISKNLNFAEQNKEDYSLRCFFVLALCYSYLGDHEQARINIQKALKVDNILTLWGQGYRFLYLGLAYTNLNQVEDSIQMYNQAIQFSEDKEFHQLRGKTLTAIGELYRTQKDYKIAIENHSKSIQILENIGAKCDLAEAYFQRSLTYQEMGENAASEADFEWAINLFNEVSALKQVERVKQCCIV